MAAVAANVGRVELTSSSFKDESNSGEFVEGNPAELVELFTAVLDYQAVENGEEGSINQSITHGDFSRRAVGW